MEQVNYAIYEVFNFDMLSGLWSNLELDHTLLTGGNFKAQRYSLNLPECVVDRGTFSQACLMKGETSAEFVTVFLTRMNNNNVWFNGLNLHNDDIQIVQGKTRIVYRSCPGTEWVILQIPQKVYDKYSSHSAGFESPAVQNQFVNKRIKHEVSQQLFKIFQQTFINAGSQTSGATQNANLKEVQDILLKEVFKTIGTSFSQIKIPGNNSHLTKFDLIHKIIEYMINNLKVHFKISDYINLTGLSQRSLEYLVKETFDLSLRELFHVTKLNFLHREFINSQIKNESIADIMHRWGVVNLGRFSNKYKKLFNELPRETLKRRRTV